MTNQRAIILLSQMYLPAFDEEEKQAIDKAIEALTAQEPRLITNVDFENKELVDSSGSIPAWVEYRRGEEWDEYNSGQDDEWSVIYKFNFKSEFYRCWTSRPDAKRKAETPWE